MDSKSELRKYAKQVRKNLDISAISAGLCEKIQNLELYKNAKNVMIYFPKKYEINLLALLTDDKNFYLPKVSGDDLLVCPYSKDLKKSEFNVFEPCTEPVNPDILDLIIVPALMVDFENYRLGYGGGYYDRFFEKYPDIKTIAPVASELYVPKLPHESYDIPVFKVIY